MEKVNMRILKDRYVNLFTDYGFKKLFGTEFNKPLLVDFLNELIGKDVGKIAELTFLPTEQLPLGMNDRKAIFDIYCENEKGEKFIVEMQKAKQNYFKDRSVFYSTFPIQQQSEKGDWDFRLNAVFTIGILDFVFDEDKDDNETYHHEVKLVDTKTDKLFYDKLTYIYLEMPKFNKTEEELETHFDKWLFVLKNLHHLTEKPARFQEKIFSQIFDETDLKRMSDDEYQMYEESLKHYRDLKNSLDTAFDEGKIEGKIETAAVMKKDGISVDTISKYTGLSKDEIDKL
jgi:predicted transposase/invertase (TIGR01784 family)